MKTIFQNSIILFIVLAGIFIPFSFDLFPFQERITTTLFGAITEWIAEVFRLEVILHDFSSDSTLLWILMVLLISISIVTSLIFRSKINLLLQKYSKQMITCLTAYLIIVTAKYGFDKLFFTQFYPPNPNILATPLGNLDQDIAFWSIIGANKGINVFMGLAELVPCFLILHPKTRKAGLLMLFGVYSTVLMVNLCFDISVKLFSAYLLILSSFLWFHSRKINAAFVTVNSIRNILSPALIFILMLWEGLYRHVNTESDWILPNKTFFIEYCEINGQKEEFDPTSLKFLHIHKNDYLIFQDYSDNMMSYKFNADKSIIQLDNKTSFSYSLKNTKLYLRNEAFNLICTMKQTPYPLEKQNFHWSVDSY